MLPGQPGVSIGCDNFHGGQLVGEHLYALGRRQVAFLGDASNRYPEFFARYRGCGVALHDWHVTMDPSLQVDAESSEEAGYAAAQTLLARGKPFDAVFAASDLIAIGAMRALTESGLRVPEDVSVVGFDDIPMARFANPALTTVYQNTTRAGELLVEALLKQIRDEPIESQMIPASLIVRKSSGAVFSDM